MAAQTLTAASNFDGPSLMLGLLNGEAITVNGGALTIDSDVRWNQNAAVHGSITVSATLGGSVLFEGRNVWELPYTAAAGNVPAQAALGSNGVTGGTSAATGELLRVWGTGLEPLAAGGAMPATGWVKLRSKSGTFLGGEVVTLPGGATITISGPGKRSWLHIVGADAATFTIPRLADVKWRGEWFELGATSGADDQTFQWPVADACPAFWVEKYPGSYGLLGEFGLEPWLNAGLRWGTATQFVATDERGKYFGQNLTTGVITVAQRATNACGYKPAAGCRVFAPNLIASTAAPANFPANARDTNFGRRYEMAVTQSGSVDMQGVSCNWYMSFINGNSVDLSRCSTLEAMTISNISKQTKITDFALGLGDGAVGLNNGIVFSVLFSGLEMTRARFTRHAVSSTYGTLSDVTPLNFDDVTFECFGNVNSAVQSSGPNLALQACNGFSASDIKTLGVPISVERTSGGYINNLQYADTLIGTTIQTSTQKWAVTCSLSSSDIRINGFSSFAGLADVHPFAGILVSTTGAQNCALSGVGAPTAPYGCGSVPLAAMGNAVKSTLTKGLKARRIYLANNRLSPVDLTAGAVGTVVENVWARDDIAQAMSGSSMTIKGGRWAVGTAGVQAVYGSHWQDSFASDVTGRILIACNEPTAETEGQALTSFAPGSGFTGAGNVSMATVGDYVECTMPYFALGHTALANSNPTVTGTNVGNHTLEFQANTGGGFGPWQALTGANLAAVGSIDPATGIKLKVRATVVTANANNLLTYIRIDTVTDATSQQIQYPLPGVLTTLQAQVALTGAEIRIYDMNNLPAGSLGTELAGAESSGATFTFDTQAGNSVWIQIMAPGYIEYGQAFTVPSTDTTLSVILQPELND